MPILSPIIGILCQCNTCLTNVVVAPRNRYSETDIIRMVEVLINSIFVDFFGRVNQQTVGIPMAANCAPLVVVFIFD